MIFLNFESLINLGVVFSLLSFGTLNGLYRSSNSSLISKISSNLGTLLTCVGSFLVHFLKFSSNLGGMDPTTPPKETEKTRKGNREGPKPTIALCRVKVNVSDSGPSGICQRLPYYLFVKPSRNNKKGGYLEYPGGHIDPGETPKQAALRELKEETGLSFKEKDIAFDYVKKSSDVRGVYLYWAHIECDMTHDQLTKWKGPTSFSYQCIGEQERIKLKFPTPIPLCYTSKDRYAVLIPIANLYQFAQFNPIRVKFDNKIIIPKKI